MCHFHSVVVSLDGRVYHLPENSHSGIAAHYGLTNGPDKQEFFEVEWDGRGEMPFNLVRQRYYTERDSIPALVRSTAEAHYRKLAAILRGELKAEDTAPFNLPEYADVAPEIERFAQWESAEALRRQREAEERERARIEAEERQAQEQEAHELVDAIEFAFGSRIDSLTAHQIAVFVQSVVDLANGDAEEIFADLIAEKVEDAEKEAEEKGYESGRDQGWQDAADEYYSIDCVNEMIDEAKSEWESEQEEKVDEAREEGYCEGFAAALSGASPAPDYINGLPSFLFAK
jgi:hypothetical protein